MAREHRHFYVNDKLEFSFYYDPEITDERTILEEFYNGLDWKSFISYFNLKPIKVVFSEDLKRVDITTK